MSLHEARFIGLKKKEIYCYLTIVLIAGILTAVCEVLDPSLMELYFGKISSLLLLTFLASLGAFAIAYLKRFQFEIYQISNKGLLSALMWASLFAFIIIGVEHIHPLAQDINVPFPKSLAFYPAIIFYVEIIFHIIPLAFLLFLDYTFLGHLQLKSGIWIILVVIALLEPLFQLIMSENEGYATMLTAYIALHIYLINLTQLHLYRKYDFLTMVFFRLVYYLIWHVIWGQMRLDLLF